MAENSMHAVGMRRHHRPSLLTLATPLGSRHQEDAQGAALAAGELAAGKLSVGQQPPCLCATDRWDQADLGAQLSAPMCALHRVHVVFCRSSFKGIFEMISKNMKMLVKIHILVKLAPKLLKQILLCFLALDLKLKNIVCPICDTFV
jgi:hypothetical protein